MKAVINNVSQNGRITLVFVSEREPFTRSSIHTHEDSGVTCVIEGEMTLYTEGKDPVRKTSGECYYMPSGVRMTGVNTGKTKARIIDFFNYRQTGKAMTIVQGKGCEGNDKALTDVCEENLYIKGHQHP